MAKGLTLTTTYKARDLLSPKVKAMGKNTKSFASTSVRALSKVSAAMSRVTRSITGMLGNLGVYMGGYAIVSGVRNIIKVWGDFEHENKNLEAVLGRTSKQTAALRENAKMLGTITAKTATQVTGLQLAFARLGFSQAEILNMTRGTIYASVAMRSELSETAELIGAMVRSYDKYESVNTPEIADKMTTATKNSALSFEKLQTALPIVAGAANAAGISFDRTLALLGKLSDAGIDASMSATALRNIFIQSSKLGLSYSQILDFIVKNTDKLTAAYDAFGKRPAVSALVLSVQREIGGTAKLLNEIRNSAGASMKAHDKQMESMYNRIVLLKSAYQGWILSVEDGNGTMNKALKRWIDAGTALFLLMNNSEYARKEVEKLDQSVINDAMTIKTWAKRLLYAIGIFIALKAAIVAFEAVMIAAKIAVFAFNNALKLNVLLMLFAVLLKIGMEMSEITEQTKSWSATWKMVFDDQIYWLRRWKLELSIGWKKWINNIFIKPILAVAKVIDKVAYIPGLAQTITDLTKLSNSYSADISAGEEKKKTLWQDLQAEIAREAYNANNNAKVEVNVNDNTEGDKVSITEQVGNAAVKLTNSLGEFQIPFYSSLND